LFSSDSPNIDPPSSAAPPDARPPRDLGDLLLERPARERYRAPPQAGVGFAPRAPRADEQRQPLGGLVLRARSPLQHQKYDERDARERRQPDVHQTSRVAEGRPMRCSQAKFAASALRSVGSQR